MEDDVLGTTAPAPRYDSKKDALFAMTYVETGDPVVAAMRAEIHDGSMSIIATAEHYLARPEIKAAVQVIQTLTRDNAPVKITRESIVESTQTVFEKALTDRQYGSAISALKLQSALLGLLEQKVTVSHNYDVKFMSTSELQRMLDGHPEIEGQYRDITDDA